MRSSSAYCFALVAIIVASVLHTQAGDGQPTSSLCETTQWDDMRHFVADRLKSGEYRPIEEIDGGMLTAAVHRYMNAISNNDVGAIYASTIRLGPEYVDAFELVAGKALGEKIVSFQPLAGEPDEANPFHYLVFVAIGTVDQGRCVETVIGNEWVKLHGGWRAFPPSGYPQPHEDDFMVAVPQAFEGTE